MPAPPSDGGPPAGPGSDGGAGSHGQGGGHGGAAASSAGSPASGAVGSGGGAFADEVREDSRLRSRLEHLVPDVLKRTFYAGVGALFTTEEGIRRMASEFQLPKDVANYLIHQAATSKDELFRVVARELRGFLESVNVSGELQKLLTSLSFEVKTEIRFIPNEESVAGVRPEVRQRASVKRAAPAGSPRGRRRKKPT